MNNNRREEGRGRSRRRRGGPRSSGVPSSVEQRNSGAGRHKDGDQRSRQDKDQQSSTGESMHLKERRNNHGGRSRAKESAKNTSGGQDANGTRGLSKRLAEDQTLMCDTFNEKQAEDNVLKAKEEEERVEAEHKDFERKEAERLEAERKESERKEAELKEKELLAAKAAETSEKRKTLRMLNITYCGESSTSSRITEAELRKLDSSLKKVTGFIRKLRGSGITEDSHKLLLADVRNLNLSRYISEVVTAISECKLRSSDTDYAAVVCSELHQRFDEFSSQLSASLSTVVLCTHANAGKDLSSRRGAMRLLVELFVLGMHPDVGAINAVLRELIKSGRESRESAVSNVAVISNFARVVSRTLLVRSAAPKDSETPVHASWEFEVAALHTKQAITAALEAYYKGDATKLYMESRNELREAESATLRARQTKGTVDDTCAAKLDSARQTCERIFSACSILSDALGKESPMPVSDVIDGDDANKIKSGDGGSGFSVVHGRGSNAKARDLQDFDNAQEIEPLFDSEEDRAFYNDLPNTARCSDAALSEGNIKSDSSIGDCGRAKEKKPSEAKTGIAQDGGKAKQDNTKVDQEKCSVTGRTLPRKKGEKNPSLDHLLARLGATETRENADRFTFHFINVAENSRKATQRLSKSLIAVSPQKLNVLPAYARIAASLRPVYPEVATNVAETLEKEFRIFAERTDLDDKTLASCIKTARYLGEYCKFRMVDYEAIFNVLSFCIKDLEFAGHRIDMTCHLLETCGRMIYRTPSSTLRMGSLLDTVWRLKSVKNLEQRHNTLVETAFHAARPSSGIKLQRHKIRPPLHEYVRRLIYSWLTPETVKWTALQMKRLPWDDELEQYVIKKFVKVSRMRFSTIPEIAMLIAAVGKYRKAVLVGVVDGILETIRAGMERNDGRDAQRRVSEVALLGELYNAHVISEKVVFTVLYQFITLGHDVPVDGATDKSIVALLGVEASGSNLDFGSLPSSNEHTGNLSFDIQTRRSNGTQFYLMAPDPPKDYFRIRLICTLIEACGRCLLREKRRKLQVFWALFERYVFCKAIQSGLGEQLPLHVDHIVSDAFEKMTRRDDSTVEQVRKSLSDGNSRIRVRTREMDKRDKRIALQAKADAENCTEDSWVRCKTLQEGLKRVEEIEKNQNDCALISLPVRSISVPPLLDASRQNKDGFGISSEEVGGVSTNKESLAVGSTQEVDEDKTKIYDRDYSPSIGNASESPDIDSDSDTELEDGLIDDEDLDELEEASDVDIEVPSDEASLPSEFDVDEEEDDEAEDEDEEDVLMEQNRPKTEEEEMFEKELAAFTALAVQNARESPSRVPTLNRMAIPMGLMAQKLAQDRAAAAARAADLSDENMRNDLWAKKKRANEVRVGFKFLVRKGGKSQIQDLAVPASSSLAVAARESESAGAAVQEEKKRLVLESSIVVNGDDDDSLDHFVPLRTQQDARAKEQSIKEQRSADEMALLSTLFKHKPRR